MVHRVDDRTCTKEQHRLEEGVGQQVEHRDRIDADARRHEHVAELRAGRIGDHALDVVLDQPHGRREERGRGADQDDERLGVRREFVKRRHPADEEHARRHHGRGVDQGRHRRRPLHRVGQPGVKPKLRRLAHRADEQQHRRHLGRVPVAPEEVQLRLRDLRHLREDLVELDRAGQPVKREDAEQKAEIADAVHDERLHRGGVGAGFLVVEADQQVGGEAHPFPAEEHLQKVVGRHQHQHREGEERQIGEEPGAVGFVLGPVVVMGHVAQRIQVDERGHGRHHDQHDRGQPVDADAPRAVEALGYDPVHDVDVADGAVKAQEHRPRHGAGRKQHDRGQDLRALFRDHAPAEARDDRGDQGREEDELFHARALSLSSR